MQHEVREIDKKGRAIGNKIGKETGRDGQYNRPGKGQDKRILNCLYPCIT